MKAGASVLAGGLALAVAVGAGYWLGHSGVVSQARSAAGAVAVPATAPTEPAKQAPKLLYYRNPMGLADTSPVPKKDSMGMDYIAVFDAEPGDEPLAANQIKISTDKVQKLGVRTEPAQLRSMDRTLRLAGRVEPDERRIFMIAPKFEGYVERLLVNVTGQPVGKGQALFAFYSPELVSAQREYAIAAQGAQSLKGADSHTQQAMASLVESSLQRLRNWDISEEQLRALVASGESRHALTFRSPVAGIVTEKKAVQGMRFMPGDVLYQVSDLSTVWVMADVPEQDIGSVRSGSKARISIHAYPEKIFEGTVTYIYPTLKAETRTVPVRVELANPGLLLKPSMFAQVELPVSTRGPMLAVPVSAVIDSGTRQVVLVQRGAGRFEPRAVKLGERSDDYVVVRDGLQEGDMVVTAANFLIDAESNLKAAIAGFGSGGAALATPLAVAQPAPPKPAGSAPHAGH